jgi:hypothetical protein
MFLNNYLVARWHALLLNSIAMQQGSGGRSFKADLFSHEVTLEFW